MKIWAMLAGFLLVLQFSGCASRDQVYHGIYQGMQSREEMVRPDAEPGGPEPPSYDTYKREREEALKKGKEIMP